MNEVPISGPVTQTSSDACAIRDLIHRYATYLDDGDFDSVAELFTEGDWNGRVGRQACLDYLSANVILYADGTPRTHHAVTNVIIEFDRKEHARARSRTIVFQQPDNSLPIETIASVDYWDSFTKSSDVWRFGERRAATLLLGDQSRHLRVQPTYRRRFRSSPLSEDQ